MAKLDAQNERVVRVKKGATEKDAVSLQQLLDHINNRKNPHLVTSEQLGISVLSLTSNEVYNDSFTGVINGTNVTFITSDNFVAGSTRVYLNGLRMKSGSGNDYTESLPNLVIFEYALPTGSNLIMDFLRLI